LFNGFQSGQKYNAMTYQKEHFPQEHLVELKGLSPFLVGRIVISEGASGFDAEVDIIQSQSGKIYNHVGMIFSEIDPKEALDLGLHQLKQFLLKKK
jgi:hypothetical protein